jgi:RNA polymerase sigma-70 factor (ECF subfamily)
MKYTYRFVTGESVGIEVSTELEALMKNEDRLEYNNDHANTRRHVLLDTGKDGGADCLAIDDENLQALFAGASDEECLRRALKQLTPKQQALLCALFWNGMSISQYAQQTGVSQPAISQQLATALKKLKEFF